MCDRRHMKTDSMFTPWPYCESSNVCCEEYPALYQSISKLHSNHSFFQDHEKGLQVVRGFDISRRRIKTARWHGNYSTQFSVDIQKLKSTQHAMKVNGIK